MGTTIPAMPAGSARGGRTVPRPPSTSAGSEPPYAQAPAGPPPLQTFQSSPVAPGRIPPRPQAVGATSDPARLSQGKQGLTSYGGVVGANAEALRGLHGPFQL